MWGAIRSSGADIVALPEACNARLAQAMVGRLKMSRVYAPHQTSHALDFFESGLALLSRFTTRRSSNFTVFFDTDVRPEYYGLGAEINFRGTARRLNSF